MASSMKKAVVNVLYKTSYVNFLTMLAAYIEIN